MSEKNYSDTEKLQLLLDHWLQHNESHVAEYLKWADVARQNGQEKAAEFIDQAVGLLNKADQSLEKALEMLLEHRLDHGPYSEEEAYALLDEWYAGREG